MPTPYSDSGQTISVEAFLRQPELVLHRMLDISEKGFIVDELLQEGYNADGGYAAYTRSESIYLDGDPEEIPEGTEYPVIGPSDVLRLQEIARKYGLKHFITEEAVRRSIMPEVEKALQKLKNMIIRYVDGIFLAKLIADTGIQTRAAEAAWGPTATNVGRDLENSRADIRNVNEGYEATDIVIHSTRLPSLTTNDKLGDAYKGNVASEHPQFTGYVGSIWGLNILHTPNLPATNIALILQRKMVGGIADEVPMQARPLPFDESTDKVWLKGRRITATFLTDPLAVVKLTGI